VIQRIFYGPSDWLVSKFDSRARRAFGFWTLLLAATGALFWGREVLYVTILSVLALVPNFTAETPVEEEG
jgi:hypothetical protein